MVLSFSIIVVVSSSGLPLGSSTGLVDEQSPGQL